MKQVLNFNQVKFSNRQSGAALFVSLIILITLTIIGLSAARRSTLQEQISNNLHLQNLAFNAAESALGSFVSESKVDGERSLTHIMQKVIDKNGVPVTLCYNNLGQGIEGSCGTTKIDSDHGSGISSELNAMLLESCGQGCSGYSKSGGLGCRTFQLTATGTAGTQSVTTQLFAYELTSCKQQ